MTTPRESSNAAIVVVVLLLIPLLIGGSYVVGYFVCSGSAPWQSERFFASESRYNFFLPLIRIEERLRGNGFVSGHDLHYVELTDPRDWTAADGQEFVAEFIERTGVSVRLKTFDGEIVVPLDSLSENDREWVEGR